MQDVGEGSISRGKGGNTAEWGCITGSGINARGLQLAG